MENFILGGAPGRPDSGPTFDVDTVFISSDPKNLFKFKHALFNLTEKSGLQKSIEFATPKIPGIKFKIHTQINVDTKTMDVTIKKDNPRKFVSIITLKIGGTTRTDRFFDWKKNVFFKNIPLPITSDACPKNHNFVCVPSPDGHKYTVTITCTIIWNGFVEDLYYPDVSTVLEILHNDEECSPIVIKVQETEFIAHKNIIAAHSPVFYKMLTSDMEESNENSMTFPDTEPDVIGELLLFFYKGKMDKAEKDADLALKLFEFAHKYEIERVISTCEYILITKLTKENVSKIHDKGQLYKSVILRQHAITFIEMNATEMRDDAALEMPPNLSCTMPTFTSEILPQSTPFSNATLPFVYNSYSTVGQKCL
ncbi:GSCOCG00007450001-RA-CDS [Cotesia congregata]|nr:GSCOCG00007450001-RA-CDS [Cotesia congregata]